MDSRPWLKFAVDAGLGLVLALIISVARGVFHPESASAAFMALSDGFFVSGALLLGGGGLQWTYNGGVLDGLTFTFRLAVARMRRDFDDNHFTFAEHRQEREAKASSPRSLLLAGLVHMAIALIFFGIYSMV